MNHSLVKLRSITDEYGLAYMTAKNYIGPFLIGVIFFAIRKGLNVQCLLNSFRLVFLLITNIVIIETDFNSCLG